MNSKSMHENAVKIGTQYVHVEKLLILYVSLIVMSTLIVNNN